jgi:peptide deformylase
MEIPNDGKVWKYGPLMRHVESLLVQPADYEQLPELRDYMISVMNRHNGIGIAAPQVGVFIQLVVIEDRQGDIISMVNPTITKMHGLEKQRFEACLSLPPSGNGCLVPRMEYITVEYATVEKPHIKITRDMRATDSVVAQHEIDHLYGVFFIDRVGEKRRREVLNSFEKWKQENENPRRKKIAEDHSRSFANDIG